jgi:hypothetical protein
VQILAEYRSGQYDEAIQSADALALDDEPTVRARALIFRGMAKLRLGRKAQSQADFNEATDALSLGDRRSGWWNVALNEIALDELRQMLAEN